MSPVVDGLRIDAADYAGDPDRAAIVLLHEGLGSVGLWRDVPRELHRMTQRRVIAYSRFGHGRSQPPRSPRTPSFFRDEALDVLPDLLAQLDAHAPILVGHSDGASIAIVHAAHHPVSGLALLAPHVFVEDVTIDAIWGARDAYTNGDLRERMSRHHDDPDAAFRGWCDVWLDPGFRGWDLERDVRRVKAPTLLIQGEDDPYGTLEQLDRIETYAGGSARTLVVPGGHAPHLEQARVVVDAIVDFTADLE